MKRNVFLFGAGAVLDWKAPSTDCLTKMILEAGFFIKDNQVRITKFIYDKLIYCGKYDEKDINFETIINVLEELIVYYSYFNNQKKLPSLLSSFFEPCYEEELCNFTIEPSATHRLIIPGLETELIQIPNLNEVTHKQYFFQILLDYLLYCICLKVKSLYAFDSMNDAKIVENVCIQEANIAFLNWMKSMQTEHVLRMYSLNYDRNFKVILEHAGISVFEGFDCGEVVPYKATPLTSNNIQKILCDFDSPVHYNLHGCIFWDVKKYDNQNLENSEVVLGFNFIPFREIASSQIEKGKSIMISKIITGYQKAQKTVITPFKQIQASFYKDCFLADDMYIIGYSFGDEHINTSIKTALKYNDKLIVHIVDPSYDDGGDNNSEKYIFSQYWFINMFSELLNNKGGGRTKIANKCHSYFGGRVMIYATKFKEFLAFQHRLTDSN